MQRLEHVHPAALTIRAGFHPDIVTEVAAAIAHHKVVVVGMGWNPAVGAARRTLTAEGAQHHYLGYGNYLTGWRRRLALKLWANWPTFPMVFIGGTLVGGSSDLKALKKSGDLARLLA